MQKRKGFNKKIQALCQSTLKINVPEDYVRNLNRIDSIRSVPHITKTLKYQDHHLFQSQLKHQLKYHNEHAKAQQLLLLSMESR